MRVITGTARGRRLKELEGTETRPTTDRVKEGLFSALQFDIEGRRVLDLFAGTGQLGIECLSRGAASAVFVDRMMRQAELDAKTKVSDSEVLYAAKEKARQMVARAEERCRQLYQVTNEYAEDALARTEEAVQMALDEVKQQRVRFRSASAAKMQEQRDKLDGRTPPQEDGGEE